MEGWGGGIREKYDPDENMMDDPHLAEDWCAPQPKKVRRDYKYMSQKLLRLLRITKNGRRKDRDF